VGNQIRYASVSVGSGVQGPFQFLFTLNSGDFQYYSGLTDARTTGIGIFGAATGISVLGAGTGVSVVARGTGISGTNNTGSGTPVGLIQPSIVTNKIIKT
jgi:hypothetical protein